MKLSLPEGVELKDGDSAIITIKTIGETKLFTEKSFLRTLKTEERIQIG